MKKRLGKAPKKKVKAPKKKGKAPKKKVKFRYNSEPVDLNSILCEFFGFEVSEDLFQTNKEFLQKICDLMPASDNEWLWVWRNQPSDFSQEEHGWRMEFFVGIWNDECYKRHVGPTYPHQVDLE